MFEAITIVVILIGISCIFISYTINNEKNNNKEKIIDDYEEYQSRLAEINNKIIELNDYSEFIKKEFEEKHNELIFLYQLINEKSKEVNQVSRGETVAVEEKIKVQEEKPDKQGLLLDIQSIKNSKDDNNGKILALYNKGFSIKEIAKTLDVGQGEVKLIINLYR